VDLVERGITNVSKGRDIVLDIFGGSGATLSAAERTGRSARFMELHLRYIDVIVQHWQNHAGQVAVLHGEDRIFNDLKRIRSH
jgi:DNA modification methylase